MTTRSISSDPNLVRFHYIGKRVLRDVVSQYDAGRSRRHFTGTFQIPWFSAEVAAEPATAGSAHELVQRALEIIDFGTVDHPGRFIIYEGPVDGFELRTKNEGYRVALVRTRADDPQRLAVFFGSIENIVGAQSNPDPSPTGYVPSFAGALEPLLQRLSTRQSPGKRHKPLPGDNGAIEGLVRQAAEFAFDLDRSTHASQHWFGGSAQVAAEVWYGADDIDVVSLPRGGRHRYQHVVVGTPLWICTMAHPLAR